MTNTTRNVLLASASVLALTAGPAFGQTAVTFNSTAGTTTVSGGLLSLLADQINNSVVGGAALNSATAPISLGASTSPGPQSVSGNSFTAAAAGNTVAPTTTGGTSLDISATPSGGRASALVVQTNDMTTSALAAAIGNTLTLGAGQITSATGTPSSMTISGTGAVSAPLTLSGNTMAASTTGNNSTVNAVGAQPATAITGQTASLTIGPNTTYRTDVTRLISPNNAYETNTVNGAGVASTAGAGDSFFRAEGTQPGDVISGTIADQVVVGTNPLGNTTLNAAVGTVTAQRNINLDDPAAGLAAMTAANLSSAIRQSSTAGTTAATVTLDSNAITSSVIGNNAATLTRVLAGGNPVFNGGAAAVTSQANVTADDATFAATTTSAFIGATANGAGTATTGAGESFASSNVRLRDNAISAAASGNTASSNVSLAGTVTAGGSNANAVGTLAGVAGQSNVVYTDTFQNSGSLSDAQLNTRFGAGNWTRTGADGADADSLPDNVTVVTTMTVGVGTATGNVQTTTADYLSATQQRNLASAGGPLSITAATSGSTVAAQGGMSGSTAAVTGNAFSAAARGNSVASSFSGTSATETVGLQSGASAAVTSLQENQSTIVSGTVSGSAATITNAVTNAATNSPDPFSSSTLTVGANSFGASALGNVAQLSATNVAPVASSTTDRVATLQFGQTSGAVNYTGRPTLADGTQATASNITLGAAIAGPTFFPTTTAETTPIDSTTVVSWSAPAGGSLGFTGAISIANMQTNQGVSSATQASATAASNTALITSDAATAPSASTLAATSNAMTATAGLNAAVLSTSLASGNDGSFYGGIALGNAQGNVFTAAGAGAQSVVGGVVAGAGNTIGVSALNTAPATDVMGSFSASTVTASSNRLAALSVLNEGTSTLTTPDGVVARGTGTTTNSINTSTAQVDTTPVNLSASYLIGTVQGNARLTGDNTSTARSAAEVSYNNVGIGGGLTAASTGSVQGNVLDATASGNVNMSSMTLASAEAGVGAVIANRQANNLPIASVATTQCNTLAIRSDALADGTSVASGGASFTNATATVASNTLGATSSANRATLQSITVGGYSGTLGTSTTAATLAVGAGIATGSNTNASSVVGGYTTVNSVQTTDGQTGVVAQSAASANNLLVSTPNAVSSSTLSVSANAVDAAATGNVATLAAAHTGTGGSAVMPGGVAVSNVQRLAGTVAGTSATASANLLGVTVGAGGVATTLTDGTALVASNRVSATAIANDATGGISGASAITAAGRTTPTEGIASVTLDTASTGNVLSASADYTLGSYQVFSPGTGLVSAVASSNQATVLANGVSSLSALEANAVSATTVANRFAGTISNLRPNSSAGIAGTLMQVTEAASVPATAQSNLFSVTGSRTDSMASVSGNTVAASATINDGRLAITGLTAGDSTGMGNASASVTTSASNAAGVITTTAPVALAALQSNTGLVSTSAIVGGAGSGNTFQASGNSTGSSVMVNGNTSLASLAGNNLASSITLDGPGLGSGEYNGALANVSTQANTNAAAATLAATNTNTVISADGTATNSTVSVQGNTIGASVGGNIASRDIRTTALTIANGGTVANGTTSVPMASGTGAVLNIAAADYVNAGVQRNVGASSAAPINFSASVSGASIGASGSFTSSVASVTNNRVFADATANSMSSLTSVARTNSASMQNVNVQENVNTRTAASVSNSSLALTGGTFSAGPGSISNNSVAAVASGNVLRASVTR